MHYKPSLIGLFFLSNILIASPGNYHSDHYCNRYNSSYQSPSFLYRERDLIACSTVFGSLYACASVLNYFMSHTGSDYLDVGLQAQKCFDIPPELRSLSGFDLLHLGSAQQQGNNCAWHALFNGEGLNQCLYKKEDEVVGWQKTFTEWFCHKIGRKKLSNFNNECMRKIRKNEAIYKKFAFRSNEILEGLSIDEIFYLARAMRIGCFCICEINEQGIFLVPYEEKFECYKTSWLGLKKFFFELPVDIFHIVLAIAAEESYHAVLLTRVNRKNKKPLFVYVDSNNVSLYDNDVYVKNVRNVIKQIALCFETDPIHLSASNDAAIIHRGTPISKIEK